jgi:glycine/sarcosine N-methyltransferase
MGCLVFLCDICYTKDRNKQKDVDNMGFYDEIVNYYDDLFPIGEAQLKLIQTITNEPSQHILDVACGSGGYSIELAKQGHHVIGMDLDQEMIRLAREKAKASDHSVQFKKVNMLEIKQINQQFDTIFCIGNSLVHLNNKEEIKNFLKQAYDLLNPGGNLLLQIINFDRVIEKDITELPIITKENKGIVFKRNYQKENQHILFKTHLKVDNQVFDNTVTLYPLFANDLIQLLKEVGFKQMETYGDFKQSPYEPSNSYHLVITAHK